MTELQDGPGQLRVSVTQVIGQCSTLKPVLTDIEGRINTFKQLCPRHQSLPDWIQMMNTSKIQSENLIMIRLQHPQSCCSEFLPGPH
jgi:hypothetical protein